MKRFWSKLLFRDAPAQGAFFALTLCVVGWYVLASFLFFLCLEGLLCSFWELMTGTTFLLQVFLVLFSLLFLYFWGYTSYFYHGLRSGPGRVFIVWGGFVEWMIFVAVANLLFGWLSFGVNFSLPVMYFAVFLPLWFAGEHWKWAVAGALAWMAGTFLLLALPLASAFDVPTSIPEKLGVSGYGWTAWIGFAFLLFLAWYLLIAKLFSLLGRIRFRAMFGLPVFILWGMAVCIYLWFAVMSVAESSRFKRQMSALEQRFGHPVTPEALGELYLGGEKPDAEFWARIERYGENVPPMIGYSFRSEISPAEAKEFYGQFERYANSLTEWERDFSGPIPPEKREYRTGGFAALVQTSLNVQRSFNRLERWRIQMALKEGDAATAAVAYERMGNANRSLRNDPSLIAALVWSACQQIRLDGLESLLESGRLTTVQLQNYADDLLQEERAIPIVAERALYGEAVFGMDAATMFEDGGPEARELAGGVPMNSMYFLLPQLRWFCIGDKLELASRYNIPDMRHADESLYGPKPYFLVAMLLPGLNQAADKFDGLTARLRATRALVAAELYRREHGDYPETMADLPLDPFGGAPLLYRKGDCRLQIEVPFWNSYRNGWEEKERAKTITVPAVQVWSVGPNGKNDDGNGDDIRAVMRIQGEGK